jgi:hypothetical protein
MRPFDCQLAVSTDIAFRWMTINCEVNPRPIDDTDGPRLRVAIVVIDKLQR